MANENKVQFGLKNVHYAVRNESGYAAPVSVPGAVNLSLDAEGVFYHQYQQRIQR